MADIVRTYVPNIVPGGELTHQVLKKLDPEFPIVYQWLTALRKTQASTSTTRPANPNLYDATYDTDDGQVYRWMGSAWEMASAVAMNVPERQTVLTGPSHVDTGVSTLYEAGTGLACKLNASGTYPVIVSFMAGFDANGAVDVLGVLNAEAVTFWSSLPANSTSYLYIDYDDGAITGGHTTVAPVSQSYEPAHSAGRIWQNGTTGIVKVSDGSLWTTVKRVPCGTATTNGSAVTAVSPYPYRNVFLIDTDATLAANSDFVVCSQKAIKAYINSLTDLPSAFIPAGVGVTGVAFRVGANATYNFCYVDCLDLAGEADAPTGLTVSVALNGTNQFTTGSITTASTTSDITDFNVSAGDLLLFLVSNTTGVAGGVMIGLRRVRR